MSICSIIAAVPLIAAALGCTSSHDLEFLGYAEGRPVVVSAAVAGRLAGVFVDEGLSVVQGAPIASIEAAPWQAQRDEAAAALARAQAQRDDARAGSRPEEIDVLLAQRDQAQAALTRSQAEYDRVRILAERGDVAQSGLDLARSTRDRDAAALKQTEAQLAVAQLGGRDQALRALEAAVDTAEATLRQADWQLSQTQIVAPLDAVVSALYRSEGEWVQVGTPIVELLAPERTKVRFFVAESMLSAVALDAPVIIRCDGCPVIKGRISYLAAAAEYTPPLIFSEENSANLVYAADAVPETGAALKLHPGLPVTVIVPQP